MRTGSASFLHHFRNTIVGGVLLVLVENNDLFWILNILTTFQHHKFGREQTVSVAHER